MQEEAAEGLELFPEEEVVPYLPQFVREQEENVSGTTRGSAYHRLLEIFPFERQETWTAAKIRTVIEECKQTEGCRRNMLLRSMYTRSGHFYRRLLQRAWQRLPEATDCTGSSPLCWGFRPNRLNTDFPEDETVLIQGIMMFIWRKRRHCAGRL